MGLVNLISSEDIRTSEMSENLANQEKSAKKSKKMETGKASAAKSNSSQETIKSVDKLAGERTSFDLQCFVSETGDDEKRKERERHNSGASSTHSQPVYSRNSWSNTHRYNKYRGNAYSYNTIKRSCGNNKFIRIVRKPSWQP